MTPTTNAYEMLARERKARKLADVLAPALEEIGGKPEDVLLPEKAEARRLTEQEAGVNPGSRKTWELVVQYLKERADARAKSTSPPA
jgi:hypothetical protein